MIIILTFELTGLVKLIVLFWFLWTTSSQLKTWSRYSTCLSVKLANYLVKDFGLYRESTGPPLLSPTEKLELHIVFLVSSLKTVS